MLDSHSNNHDGEEVIREVDVVETETTVTAQQRLTCNKLKMMGQKELFLAEEVLDSCGNMPNIWVLQGVTAKCPHSQRKGGMCIVPWKEKSSKHPLPNGFQPSLRN